MTSQKEFLRKLIELLDTARIPYMLSGSMCSSFHGRSRATNDVDIVIDPTKEQLLHFITLLGSDYYVGREIALEALKNNSMFNIIDIQAGWKADFIIRKERAYSKQEFSRKKYATVMGMNLCILAPEDSVLSKLEWSRDRESQNHLNDAMGVLLVQWDNLDFDYLRTWAKKLKIENQLEQLLEKARKQK